MDKKIKVLSFRYFQIEYEYDRNKKWTELVSLTNHRKHEIEFPRKKSQYLQ